MTVRRKIVDAAFIKIAVPSTHRPEYEVASEVRCVPLNDLPRVVEPHSGYVVIGSGKTGIDACLWLLENGVAPETIRWIMPRDAWYLDRGNFQTDYASRGSLLKSFGDQMEAAASADSVSNLFERLEAAGQLLRLDPTVGPTAYRCATVTRAELGELRRIRNIVRLGRVRRIERDRIVLERGEVPSDPNHLYVNCSAKAFSQYAPIPVFNGDTITPQCVRTCQPVFSAAFIAHVEASGGTEDQKNRLCGVVPLPETPIDWLRMMATTLSNQFHWSQNDELRGWLAQSRLDGMAALMLSVSSNDPENFVLLQRQRNYLGPAATNLRRLLAATH